MEKPKIVIGMYVGAYVSATCPMNIAALVTELSKNDMLYGTQWVTSCRVDSNRNYLIDDFLHKSKGDFLFIIDEDMVHPPSMPIVLAARDKPVISGLYFRRNEQGVHTPQIYKRIEDAAETRRGHGTAINATYEPMVQEVNAFFNGLDGVPYTNSPIALHKKDGSLLESSVIPIDAAGFGCVLLRRDALEMLDPPYLQSEPGLNGDLVFYKQCQEKGVEVYGDCSVIASHRQVNDVGVGAFCDFMNKFVDGTEFPKSNYGG